MPEPNSLYDLVHIYSKHVTEKKINGKNDLATTYAYTL